MPSPTSYFSDAGVRLSTVLKDLANRAGETIEQPADRTLEPHYAVPAMRVREALSALQRAGYAPPWRVDPDGVTRFGDRTPVEFTGRATVMRRNAALGLAVVGLENPAGLLPGNTLEGATIVRLVVQETSGKLTAEVWS
jgi:hypothetical protein